MSSRNGMPRADVDVGLFSDAKVRKLARRQRDADRTMVTMALYVATVLDSWREDAPINAADAIPAWHLGSFDDLIADLVAVELLDDDGALPRDTLDRWMAGVRARREGAALGGRGGKSTSSQLQANPRSYLPTGPTGKRAGERVSAPRARDDDDPRSLKDILRSTTGEPDIAKETH